MIYLIFQNSITWIFSLATLGAYGCYFLVSIFGENDITFILDKPHYTPEIVSILLQIGFVVMYMFEIFKQSQVRRIKWWIICMSYLLLIAASVIEGLGG